MKKTNALRILDRHKLEYQILNYQYDAENLSVEKIAKENQLSVQLIYKTLVAKGDKTGIVVALVAGNKSINLKSLAKVSKNKKMALVPVKDLLGLTGYIRGGCSPIGMKKNFPVFIDNAAAEQSAIYINAGSRGILVQLKVDDLIKVTQAQLAGLS